jgi:hypothetical protein
MSETEMLTETRASDVPAQLHERIRAFTAFYEQHAYLAYNLALRVTCEVEPAMRAVQSAFLSQLDDRPKGLVPSVVEAALYEASSAPEASGAGDEEADALLCAIAQLAPPERAALALADLAHTGPDGIGAALGLGAERAAKLLHRAREGFGARLGLPRPEADAASRDWIWAPPPEAIWQELYPRFHRTAERQARRGASENTLVLGTAPASEEHAPAPTPRRRKLHVPHPLRRRWRQMLRRWTLIVPAVVVVALAGAAAARLTGGSGARHGSQGLSQPGGLDQAPVAGSSGAAPGANGPSVIPHRQLTPSELDKLRLRELQQLNAYTKRQADRRLSPAQRNSAAQGIADLQRAADKRLQAELKREAALREQLARAKAKSNAPPPPPPPPSSHGTPARQPRRNTSTHQGTTPSNSPSSQQQVQKTCLLDQDTGQYVCPH